MSRGRRRRGALDGTSREASGRHPHRALEQAAHQSAWCSWAPSPQGAAQLPRCPRQSTEASAPPPRTQPAPSSIDGPGWDASLGRGGQPDGLQLICLRQLGSRGQPLLTPAPRPQLQTRRGAAATSRISLPPHPSRSATCFSWYQT